MVQTIYYIRHTPANTKLLRMLLRMFPTNDYSYTYICSIIPIDSKGGLPVATTTLFHSRINRRVFFFSSFFLFLSLTLALHRQFPLVLANRHETNCLELFHVASQRSYTLHPEPHGICTRQLVWAPKKRKHWNFGAFLWRGKKRILFFGDRIMQ